MSFAQEVAAAKTNTEVKAPPPQATEGIAEHFAMPEHGEVHPEQQAQPQEVAAQTETTPQHPKEGKIRIGNEVFDTPEEAMAYATELQQTLVQREAFEQGKLAAQPVTPPEPEPDFFAEIENQIFENPKEAIKKIHAKAVEDAKKYIEETEKKKEEAKRVEETRNHTWNTFYTSNTDLSTPEAKQIVDHVLQRDWKELGGMAAEKALPLLAERTRALVRSLRETQLPASVLQAGKVISTSATHGSTATSTKKESSPLDFISQINKHRKRDAK